MTLVEGDKIVSVAPSDSTLYPIHITAHDQGDVMCKIIFTNQLTNEYMFYDVNLHIKPCEVIKKIHLQSQLYGQVEKYITLANPLNQPITLMGQCETLEVTLDNSSYQIPPHSECTTCIVYKPITMMPSLMFAMTNPSSAMPDPSPAMPDPSSAMPDPSPAMSDPSSAMTSLTFHSMESGDMFTRYELHLRVLPPKVEQVIEFHVELGERCHQQLHLPNHHRHQLEGVINKLPTSVEFTCEIDGDTFVSDKKTVTVRSNRITTADVCFLITFDPNTVGDVRGEATISSPDVGLHYVYALLGKCLIPTPRGPFTFKSQDINVNFRNPFTSSHPFRVQLDPRHKFSLARCSVDAASISDDRQVADVVVNSKHDLVISVTVPNCDDDHHYHHQAVGSLIVSATSSGEKWIFYLNTAK